MDKTRGIVMKTSKRNTILYTERGDYLEIKTPKTTPLLGQVVEVDLPIRKALNQRFLKFGSIAAMLLLALGLGVFNIVSSANTAVAAVVMDINNSKELFVNRDAKVLRVIDLTQGTKTSESELKLQGKDIYTSVDLLIDQANAQGILRQSKNLVMASIIPLDNRQVNVVDQAKLRDSIGRHMLEKNISADLMVSKTDETTQKTAQSLGMSLNHYLVYKRLMDNGLITNSNGSSSNDTSHMLTEANTTINSLFPQESMTITPQSETNQEQPNSMGTPMAGGKMPSISSPESSSSQNQSPSNMMNTIPPSNQTKPANPSMSSTPSKPMPMQGGSSSTSSSGEQGMMP
ncbi:anti-sigma factor domain-containing protein [Desulfosporosinus sp. SB140]|uniref:anti-sigma factor domain-containing protein n=1 Tax=Desulfosporosinus paludis TaxID=3115649 RepID=UPI00388EDBB7